MIQSNTQQKHLQFHNKTFHRLELMLKSQSKRARKYNKLIIEKILRKLRWKMTLKKMMNNFGRDGKMKFKQLMFRAIKDIV